MIKPKDFGLLFPSLWLFGEFFLVAFVAIPAGKLLLHWAADHGVPGARQAVVWASLI